MGALTDAATFAQDPDLIPPLTAAIVRAAIDVAAEDDATAGHAARVSLATQILGNPERLAPVLAWAVSSNGTVVGKWLGGDEDGALADLPFVLGSIWDAVAGVG